MPPHADSPSPPILPVRVLAGLLAVCLIGSWFMVPKRGELIERLFKDKQYERVVAVLQDDIHGMKSGDMSGLRHLSAPQLTALSRLLNLTPREQLQAVFTSKSAPAYDAYIHNIVLAAVRYVDVLPPKEAYEIITPNLHRLADSYRLQLLLTVAHNAHGVSQPDVAASALSLASQCSTAGWPVVKEMAQSYRWSGQPGAAASRLRAWLSSHRERMEAQEVEEARELSFALALESGNPGEAFNISLLELKDASNAGAVPETLIESSLSLAVQSSRTKEMLPWLRQAINVMPEASMPLTELRRLSASDPGRFAAYKRWAGPLSRWSDWNNDFDSAFDCHLRLAILGDAHSRDRCIAISDYLGRTEECCDMLLALGEVKEKPGLALLLAQQLAELGRDDEAKVRYESWLQAHPEDRKVHYDVACLLEDMGDEPASRAAFERMVKFFPKDVPARKQLAKACIRDADYPAALKLYESFAPSEHDHDTLENYAMIAESLDDHVAELRALQLTAALSPDPPVALYLDLAETAGYLPDNQRPMEILRAGLARHPASAQLRIALATQLFQNDESDEALRTLTHENLRHNYDAIQAVLGMSERITNVTAALAFIGDDVEKRFPLSNRDRLDLAVLHFNAGQFKEAERLFASVPEIPGNFQAIAGARFETGGYDEAARLMTDYLKDNPRGSADDWHFLGDIYEQLGQFDEARKAFDYSLALLTADLPDTAVDPVRGAQ
jgi:tetratricopeptide (TPR) repeat protein